MWIVEHGKDSALERWASSASAAAVFRMDWVPVEAFVAPAVELEFDRRGLNSVTG